jgi:hypothetical protein
LFVLGVTVFSGTTKDTEGAKDTQMPDYDGDTDSMRNFIEDDESTVGSEDSFSCRSKNDISYSKGLVADDYDLEIDMNWLSDSDDDDHGRNDGDTQADQPEDTPKTIEREVIEISSGPEESEDDDDDYDDENEQSEEYIRDIRNNDPLEEWNGPSFTMLGALPPSPPPKASNFRRTRCDTVDSVLGEDVD